MRDEGSVRPVTLVGVATGRPDGGVAIVRVSGPDAFRIATKLVGPVGVPRRLVMRRLALASGVESALAVWMPAPGSFTGEDVLELHVHAGALNVAQVVERILAEGAAPAGPGDFTRRAFENGRLGLEQAEGVAALIGARSERALAQARRLVAGELGRSVEALRMEVGELRAEIEAHLDFPDDVRAIDVTRWRRALESQRQQAGGWLRRFEAGRRARERARFVLAGPPNAGKSSLFNALLGRPRAIVAESPGTTRDYLEAEFEVDGYVALVVDTAGLRSSGDATEAAGMCMSREQMAGADLVIWVEGADTDTQAFGGDVPMIDCDLLRVESKRDLGTRRAGWTGVSTRGEQGLDALLSRLREWFGAGQDEAWIGLARHRDRVTEAARGLDEASETLSSGPERLELVAFSLGVAERRLGEICGRHDLGPVGAEVLDRIFSRFCVGK